MCELMGLCFAEPVAAAFSISEFALRDVENADGWGLAWYSGRSSNVVKEPLSWRKSSYASFLSSYGAVISNLYIAHVRHATIGGAPKHADTHPFSRELGGSSYCFAHNGTVRGAMQMLLLDRYHPIGDTDSEHVFCYLLDAIADRGRPLASTTDWKWLARQLAAINAGGKLNCLLCDGERIFAWHDSNGFKGLHFHAVRVVDGEVEHLADLTMDVALEGGASNRGLVVATRPLSDQGWHACHPGELLVLESGKLRFSNVRSHGRQPITVNC